MLCPKCFQENESNALFCKHCGARLVKKESSNSNITDILLLLWAIFFFVIGVAQQLITNSVGNDWYMYGWNTLFYSLNIIRCLTNILPTLAIKNTPMKIGATVLIGLPSIYFICINITNLILGL